jgi:Toluene-4-monooxygenase system protein B (TmoB)
MAMPLYGFMEGDTIGLLILADEHESVGYLAEKLREAASLRVDGGRAMELVYGGKVLDPEMTLAEADFKPLQRFDLRRSHGLSESRDSR